MKQITDILMSKQFLIGLGVGIAGVYAYNRYIRKENISNASGGMCKTPDCSQYPVGGTCRVCSQCTSPRAKNGVFVDNGDGTHSCIWTPQGSNSPKTEKYDRLGNVIQESGMNPSVLAPSTRPTGKVSTNVSNRMSFRR
jgi:hypothetical protein